MPDFSERELRAHLPADWSAVIQVYTETDSTNTRARLLAEQGAQHGTAVIADRQTAGRGRSGRSFYSPAETGIYLSMVLRPEKADVNMATVRAAVGVCRAVERVCGRAPQIKWVNDLFLDGKKICGILAEGVGPFVNGAPAAVVLGVGINCSTESFPEELQFLAGSIGGGFSREALAAAVMTELRELTGGIEEYRERSLMIDREVSFVRDGETVTATVLGIDDTGGLILRHADGGTTVLRCGEVSVKI